MTAPQHSTPANEPGVADYINAAHEVLATLLVRMGPKKERKARAEIDRYIARLETFNSQRLPLNVVPIRGHRREAEAARLERQRLAAAVRTVADVVGCAPYSKGARK